MAAMDSVRKPFLFIAVILIFLAMLIELGSLAFIGVEPEGDLPTPGLGIGYLALLDGVVFFTAALFAAAVVFPARIMGAVQGIITFVFFLILVILAITGIFVAFGLLMLMVSLLLAIPFGTIAYMAAFADFEVGAARGTLGTLMLLKLGFALFLVLAQQRFLMVKGLVFLVLCSLVANIIVSFLHGIVPGFLVSITDAIAAIVVGIIAAIWALSKLIGSIPGIIKGLRFDRHVA